MLDIDRDGDNDWDDLTVLGSTSTLLLTPANPTASARPCTTRPDEIAYNIDLVFVEGHGFSASQMDLFEQAAERWEAIITGDVRGYRLHAEPFDSSKEEIGGLKMRAMTCTDISRQ